MGARDDTVERVVTVDEHGRPTGSTGKLAAHAAPGVAHLAFSVVLFDGDGSVLLQQRSAAKYHFAGLWTNSCCSHPRPGEGVLEAAARRVDEELGVTLVDAEVVGSFWYRAEDEASGLVEVEYDLVVRGRCDGELDPDPAEIGDLAWYGIDAARDLCRPRATPVATPWSSQVLQLAASRPLA